MTLKYIEKILKKFDEIFIKGIIIIILFLGLILYLIHSTNFYQEIPHAMCLGSIHEQTKIHVFIEFIFSWEKIDNK